ncbi:MAG TPA: D-alanyl-D-alanine carboxypeptidase family protein [Solirubrobacteraceae bacterium]|nr:D-alanyl-D-alanine carboxypeptidase family protein [Solirubrobacteraceae bacterium]
MAVGASDRAAAAGLAVKLRNRLAGLAALVAFALAAPPCAVAAQTAAGTPATPPRVSARAAIVVEESTGQVLYASRAGDELAIASTTKLMTALLTLEHVPRLSKTFTAPDYYAAPGDSQIGLVPGERMSVHDLMLALLIPSADDAAEDLAYNVGGHSVARFVGMMNARARELGLTHTHYSTPSGLDTPGNYSSASDLVKLSVYLLEHHPWFRHAVSLYRARLRTGRHPRSVVSTDTLLSQVPWISGVKTGHTAAAGYVLVGSGTRGGMTLVSAVLGTASEAARDANTLSLLGYGFDGFRLERPVVAGRVVARPTVSDSPGVRVPVLAAGSVSEMVARNTSLTIRIEVPRRLTGPRRDHAVVGSVVVSSGPRVLARVPVELSRALPAVSELTIIGRFLVRPTTLVVLVLLIGGASALGRRRRRGRRAAATAGEPQAAALAATAHESHAPALDATAGRPLVAPEGATAAGGPGAPGGPASNGAAPLDGAAEAQSPSPAERAAAERERRRAEREARRRAGKDRARSSARDRA